jgi:UTP--glucose-1-phosphate uridylyltransferase
MPVRHAIVPAAGLAKRMRPLTTAMPKEMLPLGRKPVIQHVVEELAAAGIDRVVLVSRPGKEPLERQFEAQPAGAGVEAPGVYYVHQQEQLGLGHAVLQGRDAVGAHPFAVANGDSLISGSSASGSVLMRLVRLFEARNAAAVIALERVPRERVNRYGIIIPGEVRDGIVDVRGVVEKPAADSAPSDFAISARYVFSPAVFPILERTTPAANGEIQLTDAITELAAGERPVLGVLLESGERRYDIGGFDSFYRAFIDYALADAEFGAVIQKHMQERLK